MKKIMLIMIIGMFMISFTTALETDVIYKQNTEGELRVVCLNNGFCSGAATCNVSVFDREQNLILDNVQLENNNAFHNYTLTADNNANSGLYQVKGFCVDGGSFQEINYEYQITSNGEELDEPQSQIYFFMLIAIFITIILIEILRRNLPNKDPATEDGKVIKISWLKHLRPVMVGLLIIMVTFMFYILSSVSFAYLPDTLIAKAMFSMFVLSFITGAITIPLRFVWLIQQMLQDGELGKMLKQGVEFQGKGDFKTW